MTAVENKKYKDIANVTQFYAAVFLVLEKDNKILMLRRANTGWMDGHYGLPAGKVEDGESIFQSAVREAHEEIGITVTENDIELVHTGQCHYHKEDRMPHWLYFFFKVKSWDIEPFNNEPEKADKLEWISDWSDLKMTPNMGNYLSAVKSGQNFSSIKYAY